MPKPPHRVTYRLTVSRSEVEIEFIDEHFWDNKIIDEKGTTLLDHNIASVLQELRAALYFLGTDLTRH